MTNGTTPLAGVYVGNFPQFPPAHQGGADVTTFTAGGVDEVTEWDGTRIVRRDVRVKLEAPAGWPRFLHAFTARGSAEQVARAVKVLATLRVSKGTAAGDGSGPVVSH